MRLSDPWLSDGPVRAVMTALGGEAFFVGGCVRNALIGAPVSDIDLATPLTPERVTDALEAAGLRAVPTGLAHGTVTAVADHRPIEITTFRADVETFGRHARVRFTTEMAEDAMRRDFTMNALYADCEGNVLDPMGGLPDLEARRVRFIGDPVARIREDYLRILRFFRFSAWYGRGDLDAAGLAAAAAERDGLGGLARERIGAEMKKLLTAADPSTALAAMERTGILTLVLPGATAGALPALIEVEAEADAAPDWAVRLTSLSPEAPGPALRLSRAEERRLAALASLAEDWPGPAAAAEAQGAALARGASLVVAAWRGERVPPTLEADLARGEAAEFPLAAQDLIAAGCMPGPAIGAGLAAARAAWRQSDFTLDKQALLTIALAKGQNG